MIALHACFRLDGAPVEAPGPLPGADPRELETVAGAGFALVAPATALASAPTCDGGTTLLVFDGRLDARDEIAAGLETGNRSLSIPALLLGAWIARGDDAFASLVGPFATLIVETPGPRIRLVRDPHGGRSLFLRRRGVEIAVASRPSALLDPGMPVFDEASLARYLGGGGPRPGATFFRGVDEVPPGALVVLDADRATARLLPTQRLPKFRSESEAVDRLRTAFDRAVEARLPEGGRPAAILMSGGLDSTAVAATAARLAAARGDPPPIALSWVFDRLPGANERRWIDAANRATGASAIAIPGEEWAPLGDPRAHPWTIDSPVQGPYTRLRARALEHARDQGASILLVGEGADEQLSEGARWLPDLLRQRRLFAAAAGLVRTAVLEATGRRQAYSMRSSLGRLRARRAATVSHPRPWLTDAARREIERERENADPLWRPFESPASPLGSPLDLALLRFAESESAPFGVEIRRPFRDRRVAEVLRSVSPSWLYRPGEPKRLLRRAFADRLPREVLERRAPSSLLSVFDLGLAVDGAASLRTVLDRTDAIWPRWVRRDWLLERGFGALGSADDRIERVILWSCFCVEIWYRRWCSGLDSPAWNG